MSLDARNFDLNFFGCPNIQIEAFISIQGHGPKMLKALNSKFLDPKTSNSELFASWGHAPWMLKASIGIFLDPHASKSKILTSWDIDPGCQKL